MDNQNQSNKSILLIAFIVSQIIILAIIISIYLLNVKSDEIGQMETDRQPTISIQDLEARLPGSKHQETIEIALAKTLELNSGEFNTSDVVANIREGSLITVEFKDIDGVYYSAVVDIPNLQQSYQIYSFYSVGDKTPEGLSYSTQYVLCLDDHSEKIYKDFDCRDLFPSNARRTIVFDYLNYFQFNNFGVFTTRKADSSTIYIDVDPTIDLPSSVEQSYIQETKEAVRSLGVSPELFEYKINRQSNIVDL